MITIYGFAKVEAQKTLEEVKKAMKFNYYD